MRTCQKCGFLQPPDRFCAQCGVDMDSYKPPAPPFAQRLIKNTYLQLIAIALIVFWGLNSYLQNRSSIEEEAPVITEQVSLTEEQPEKDLSKKVGNESKPLQIAKQPLKAMAVTEEIETEEAEEFHAQASIKQAFINLDQFEELLRRAKNKKNSGRIISGVIPAKGFSERPTSGEVRYTLLQGSGPQGLSAQNKITAQKLTTSTDPPLGMRISVSPTVISKEQIQLSIEITLQLNSPESDDIDEDFDQSFSSNLTLKPGETAFISGFLPHKLPPITELDPFFLEGPFRVFQSEEFLDNQAEFIILISTKVL